jgi:hypothetical protein
MPSLEMILEMGPVMVSTEFLNASSSLHHCPKQADQTTWKELPEIVDAPKKHSS